MTIQQQISIIIFGLLTFHGADANLLSLGVISLIIILSKKQPKPVPCKVYDFAEYKAKRYALKRPVSYQKAA